VNIYGPGNAYEGAHIGEGCETINRAGARDDHGIGHRSHPPVRNRTQATYSPYPSVYRKPAPCGGVMTAKQSPENGAETDI
jgi:hypothetical protein